MNRIKYDLFYFRLKPFVVSLYNDISYQFKFMLIIRPNTFEIALLRYECMNSFNSLMHTYQTPMAGDLLLLSMKKQEISATTILNLKFC